MKIIVKNLLKLIFALTLIAWLLKSGKLDFSLISKSFTQGYYWLACIGLLIVQSMLAAWRWSMLLSVKSSKKIPLFEIFKVSWIGMFFNSMLPGAVTGDLIKLVYAKDLDQELNRSFLVTSVLLDRILGLIGLLSVLGLACVFYYREVTAFSSKLTNLIHFNLLIFTGGMIFLSLLFLSHKIQEKVLDITNLIPMIGKKVSKIVHSFWILGENKKIIIKSYFLSIVIQAMNLTAFWLISHPFYSKPIDLPLLFTFIPSGLIAVAIPIAPAGMGVGHIVFDELFSFVGIKGGASFFNLYFLCAIFVNFLGVIPYLLSSKKHALQETKQFESIN